MWSLPDWAPGLHPMVVHFPIALLFLAVLLDAISFGVPGNAALRAGVAGLYLLGALAALIAFFTGRQAAAAVFLPPEAALVLTDHEDWAGRTVWFFGILALFRVAAMLRKLDSRHVVRVTALVLGLTGLDFVYQTARRGAELVFRYGVGVAAVKPDGMERHDHERHTEGRQTPPPAGHHEPTGR